MTPQAIFAALLAVAPPDVCEQYPVGVDTPQPCAPIELSVRPDKRINGWAQGRLVITTTRTVEKLPENQLAFLLAHEIGHVYRSMSEQEADCFGAKLTVKAGFTLEYPKWMPWFGDKAHGGRKSRWKRMQICATQEF